MEKYLSYTIYIWKMRIIELSYKYLYVLHCMEWCGTKFFIYGNCMRKSFGQPGYIAEKQQKKTKHINYNFRKGYSDLISDLQFRFYCYFIIEDLRSNL